MKKLGILSLILFFIILVSYIPISFSVNLFPAYSQWIMQNGLAAPGQIGLPIRISITNLYSSLSFVNLTFYNTYPFEIFNSTLGNYTFFIPRWNQGQTLNFTLLLNIASNIKNGIYLENFSVYSGSFFYRSFVQIPILGYVSFNLQSIWGSLNNSLLVSAGETNLPLTILIKNEGNVLASNVTIFFNNSQTFPIFFYQNSLDVGYVEPGGFNVVTNVANISSVAKNGLYYIPVTIKYFNGDTSEEYLPIYILGNVSIALQSIWGSLNQPISVSAGQNNIPLTIIVKNLGSVLLSNVTLHLRSSFPIIFLQNIVNVGYIPTGSYSIVTTYASIYSNATSGLYYINVTISYFKNQIAYSLLPILISSPTITINAFTYPPQIFPGFYNVRLFVTIVDLSNAPANNAQILLKSPFVFITPTSLNLSLIPPFKPLNLTSIFNVPSSINSGLYNISIILKYDGGNITYNYPIEVYPKANIVISNILYSSLTPGSTQNLIIVTLKNTGLETAKNLKIIVQPNQVIYPHVSSSNPLAALSISTIFIGDLEPNQTFNLSLIMDVSDGANPGSYSIVLTAIWNQTGSIYPFVENLNFNIKIVPTFEQQLLTPSLTNVYFDLLLILVIVIIIAGITVFLRRRKK